MLDSNRISVLAIKPLSLEYTKRQSKSFTFWSYCRLQEDWALAKTVGQPNITLPVTRILLLCRKNNQELDHNHRSVGPLSLNAVQEKHFIGNIKILFSFWRIEGHKVFHLRDIQNQSEVTGLLERGLKVPHIEQTARRSLPGQAYNFQSCRGSTKHTKS